MKKVKVNVFWHLFIFSIILLSSSCRQHNLPNDLKLKEALDMAGSNRKQLENVLDHYSASEDSLKYKAAVFLIKYMPGKYAKVYRYYDLYKPVFDTIESLNANYEKSYKNYEFYKYYKYSVFKYFMTEHPVKKVEDLNFEIKDDIKTITADYLIENIDYAFKTLQLSWNKRLSFNDFCEYILPYRYGFEELQPWRKIYYEGHKDLLDSLKNVMDPEKAAMFLKQKAHICQSELIDLKPFGYAIKTLDLIRINSYTSCYDETGQMMLRARGLGIPVTRINIPNWGNRGSGHDLMGVLRPGNKWRGFVVSSNDTSNYKPPAHFTLTKAFAQTYSNNPHSNAVISEYKIIENDVNFVDVTRDISPITTDLDITVSDMENGTTVCLNVFNNSKWNPIVSSIVQGGRASFPQIGKNIIYMIGALNNGELHLQGNPFLLDSLGIIKPIIPSKKNVAITVLRKYPPNDDLNNLLPLMNHCYFQGSNDSSFSNAVTLWRIDTIMNMRAIEKKLKNADYQYVRLVFPNIVRKNEALGGIQFCTEVNSVKTLLKGQPISSTKASEIFYDHVFDNDPLTFIKLVNQKFADFKQYYNSDNLAVPDNKLFWIGLKLKSKTHLTSLEYSPRTDDNGINIGETYELLYWNNGDWASLGKKKAVANRLGFNAPKNALYLLKDLDKGKEQRIFLYQGNKQVWY